MKKTVIDAKTGLETEDDPMGMTGFCSWRRLTEVFRDAGELDGREEIVAFVIEERGVAFRTKRRTA